MITKILILVFVIIILVGLFSCHPYSIVNKEKSDSYYFTSFKNQVHYVPMGNWFELGDDNLIGVDINTIEVIGNEYLRDKDQVYFKSTKIKNADPSSFVVLKRPFSKDKNKVYYNSHSFQDLDVSSFQFVEDNNLVLKDKNHAYAVPPGDFGEYGPNNLIIPFVPENLQFLNKYYGKDDKVAYYKGKPIVGSDSKSFIALDDVYGKDAQTAYYRGIPITGSDAQTFILDGIFAIDRNKVYTEGIQVIGVDPATFKVLDDGDYTKDKNGVYYRVTGVYDKNRMLTHFSPGVIAGADPSSFTTLINERSGGGYTKDKNSVYKWGIPVTGIDPATFTLIDRGVYNKDKNGVYFDVDSKDEKDGKTIQYIARKVPGADPATFIMIEGDKDNYAKDKTRFYWRGIPQ